MSEETLTNYDKVHRLTWARRVTGTMTGATMGAAFGAIAGAVAAFIPYALTTLGVAGAAATTLPTFAAIAMTAGTFAGVAAFIGLVIGSDVGANSASVAAGLDELERRDKAKGIAHAKEKAPDVQYFNWKIAATNSAIFGTFGALLGSTGSTIVTNTLATALGGGAAVLTGPAATIGAALMFGMFGSVLGVKCSVVSNKISNFYTNINTGKYFENTPAKAPAQEIAPAIAEQREFETQPEKTFATSIKRHSLEQLIIEQKEGANKSPEFVVNR